MIAVLPVRGGILPAGSLESAAEAGGRALLVGDGTTEACALLRTAAKRICAWEAGTFRPGAWSEALAPLLKNEDVIILPASADGRDLAPRLAHVLGIPLIAGAVRLTEHEALVLAHGGLAAIRAEITGPVVVTLQPGAREVSHGSVPVEEAAVEIVFLDTSRSRDAEVLEILPPDPATIDLSEARRIVAGGRGLGGPEVFESLAEVAAGLRASLGATRAATDVGWADAKRFIGVTGASVNPALYIALGISGAVQHVNGLGSPDHIISINIDPGCPMMALADLAIVADAPSVVAELVQRLKPEGSPNG